MAALDRETLLKGLGRITKSAAGNQIVYTELCLEERQLSELELLGKYPHLSHLALSNNKIRDLAPLAGLPHLLTLDLSHNQLESALDFDPPANLHRADLSYNKISQLSGLAGHLQLATLVLSNNQITSLAPLAGLSQLRYLDASFNQLDGLEGLSDQPLIELHLSNNRLASLDGVQRLAQLQVITVEHNQLNSLEPLREAKGLYAVSAAHNKLELEQAVGPLQELSSLRHLSLAGNPLATGLVLDQTLAGAMVGLPDMRRACYPDAVLYKLLRLETLDQRPVQPEDKVLAANLAGVDQDAHEACHEKYFPKGQGGIRDKALVLARLMYPSAYKPGRMVFPDVWVHQQLERCLQAQYQCVCHHGSWQADDAQTDLSEVCVELVLQEPGPTHLVLMLGQHQSCNAGTQKLKSSIAVQRRQPRQARVRRLFGALDKDSSGAIDKAELGFADRNGRFFGKLDGDKDGRVTVDELVSYFEGSVEQRGEAAVDAFIGLMEQGCTGEAAGPMPVESFLESSPSMLIGTVEGWLKPESDASMSYQVVAQAVLQGAAVEAAGEGFFLWVFGSSSFTLGGLQSTSCQQMVDHFSPRLRQDIS